MVPVHRTSIEIQPDIHRVVAKPFLPGEMTFSGGPTRVELIGRRVLAFPAEEVTRLLESVRARFHGRHRDLDSIWRNHAEVGIRMLPEAGEIEGDRRLLLGAFFTQEYAPGAAAVCNPSMVTAPDSADGTGFVMSLRSIGEGHISSVEFRTGRITGDGVEIDPPSSFLQTGARRAPVYDNRIFRDKLMALHGDPGVVTVVMDQLPDRFTTEQLEEALDFVQRSEVSHAAAFETARLIHWLAASNYELVFSGDEPVSERLLHPAGPADSRGMEDARFVRFCEPGTDPVYYATYTAFDGFTILPQLIETRDFVTFRLATLDGACASNKGMALFPRRIGGLYMALGRHDVENLHVLRSDRIRVWNHAELIAQPEQPWEAVQIGNCGSPIETPDGWLVLTHGVGPMRRYAIGALLLDLDEPAKVLGRLSSPLIEPAPDERDGYVPNVVYSCGGMLTGNRLVIPYGYADRSVHVATVDLDDVLKAMV